MSVVELNLNLTLPREDVFGCSVVDVMASSGLCKSKGGARRLIKGGGCRLNNEKIEAEDYEVADGDVLDGKVLLVQSGKKNKLLVCIQDA